MGIDDILCTDIASCVFSYKNVQPQCSASAYFQCWEHNFAWSFCLLPFVNCLFALQILISSSLLLFWYSNSFSNDIVKICYNSLSCLGGRSGATHKWSGNWKWLHWYCTRCRCGKCKWKSSHLFYAISLLFYFIIILFHYYSISLLCYFIIILFHYSPPPCSGLCTMHVLVRSFCPRKIMENPASWQFLANSRILVGKS